MKNIRKIILVFILMFLFIISIKAENFTCDIYGYKVQYDNLGNIVEVIDSDGVNLNDYKLSTDFYPKNEGECPGEYAVITRSYRNKLIFVIESPNLMKKLSSCSDYVTPRACERNGYYSCLWNGEEGVVGHYCVDSSEEQISKDLGGCSGYSYEDSCKSNKYYSCMWNSFVIDGTTYNYCNTDELQYVQCGDAYDIPYQVPAITAMVVNLLKIATPIILIIISIITLLKAVSASNEDEIKKAQKGLIKKVTAAVMVFFVISIVQFVVMKVADDIDSLSSCLTCFLNNDCGNTTYYKTNVAGEYQCTYFKDIDNPNADKTCPQDKIKLTK